ncbi:D-aminoacyl-tRNA deacylase [Pullulanibacillus sp. KACC 23026]|uniref:D-aminoacyl-tRNA deacylase n=1 Tax=Pullulanibacillus sp. KACC 23026 TaxID=3028315 RepID=UPI0023B178E0|nr:D-aminoacyl-tRNA deacylase [Pullulanibacillus sp. KACC 23026]WEG14083.1 D-aminoacyl-tRNA deacylase [Pullulanibacillus sp. KACC 23026]
MRVVLQRVKAASVTVEGTVVGQIEKGLLLLVGIHESDTEEQLPYMVSKITELRIFEDESGKMNESLLDQGGAILSVSQFTLYGDTTKGRRPNFMKAARPEKAEPLFNQFNQELRHKGLKVETGQFGAMMDVSLINDGPVTLIIDSK